MIYLFNPGHETAVKNTSPYYTAPTNIVTMQHDLSFLPTWYAQSCDVILNDNPLNGEYYRFLINNIANLPKSVTKDHLINHTESEISLWGISPQAIHYCEELNREYNINLNIPKWHNEYLYLNSRESAKDCLSIIIKSIPELSEFILPCFCYQIEDIEKLVSASQYKLLAKAPYSSSGRGLLWIPETGLTRTERQILHGILKKQGSVSIEKVLNKEIDFAMEFMCDGLGKTNFVGYSLFYTNSKGGYEANYIGTQESIEKQLTEKVSLTLINKVKHLLEEILSEKYARLYKGCIGVDMMIYKNDSEYKLHPCVEINMRYNMGYLALKLFENHIVQSSKGRFHLDFNSQKGVTYQKHLEIQQEYPSVFENGRLLNGYLSLCPIDENSKYRAYMLIDK